MDASGSVQRPVVGPSEDDNETSDSVKRGEVLD
jgi:hypothetical protein